MIYKENIDNIYIIGVDLIYSKIKRIIISVFFALIIIFIILLTHIYHESKYRLEKSDLILESKKLKEDFRIVQLSDLHNSMFGDLKKGLIKEVVDANPDVIFITGDLVNNKEGSDTSIATDLIKELSQISVVYFSYGNQEKDLEDNQGIDIRKEFEAAGAVVLERDYVDTKINNQPVRIGGIYGYCLNDVYAQETHREDESEYLKDFQNTDRYKILLCHMPTSLIHGSMYDWNIDAFFCGHTHGGQIRLPFIGGLWAPDEGFFPGQMCGVYKTERETWEKHRQSVLDYGGQLDKTFYKTQDEYKESVLILSRGLGSTEKIPRFNNKPEIVVVDFQSLE